MAHAFDEEIIFAVAALRRGEIVAYPTETFYGLGVDALDELALARLRALKGRDGKAISVLVDGRAMIDSICRAVPPLAVALMQRYWPGALTIALPARRNLPAALVTDGCVAVRQSSHPTAQALVAGLGRPLTATSANRAGRGARHDRRGRGGDVRGTLPHRARRRHARRRAQHAGACAWTPGWRFCAAARSKLIPTLLVA